ncbi:MAG: hypothetical protein LBL91_02470 [Lachnospiraceae bacterium]|jgi:outer membrane lipoprotein-sorting protein|nr:hypothetical protein [Lachnospiraceae bacterium]
MDKKKVEQAEKRLIDLELKMKYFFELIHKEVELEKANISKEENEKECKLIIDKDELTIFDKDKNQVYVIPTNKILSIDFETNKHGYVLDITKMLAEYIKTVIELLEK